MKTRIDNALGHALASRLRHTPPGLAAAIRDAVFPGGARVRPQLCLAVSEACGCDAPLLADAVASSIELLHCASLVHDDLPCFDDAAVRRGRPSVHRAHGETIAVLTGDALIVMAFELLADPGTVFPARLGPLLGAVAAAVGASGGLVAGQAWESEPDPPRVAYHRAKTASLFVAATTGGALAAGADPEPWRALGLRLGEAYQVADDLLDVHADSTDKPTGQDQARRRPSAVTELGTDGALARLRELVEAASASVPECRGAADLKRLVVTVAERLVPRGLRRTAA